MIMWQFPQLWKNRSKSQDSFPENIKLLMSAFKFMHQALNKQWNVDKNSWKYLKQISHVCEVIRNLHISDPDFLAPYLF